MSLLTKRGSIRHYTKEPVSEEQIKQLLTAGMQAPSANNQQPWEFIVVDDREILDTLSSASRGAWMLQDAPLAIIPLIRVGERSPLFAQQDLSAATQNILLEATNLGLGAVWIGVYPLEDRVTYTNKVLGVTGDVNVFCMIAIGHPAKEKDITIRYDETRIHHNKWGN